MGMSLLDACFLRIKISLSLSHSRHCEILQGKVSTQKVQLENIIVICRKKILLMLCTKIIEIGSSLLKLFKIKLVTFFETRCSCKRNLKLTVLHCFNRLYLQHGGGNCCSQNDVTVSHPRLRTSSDERTAGSRFIANLEDHDFMLALSNLDMRNRLENIQKQALKTLFFVVML